MPRRLCELPPVQSMPHGGAAADGEPPQAAGGRAAGRAQGTAAGITPQATPPDAQGQIYEKTRTRHDTARQGRAGANITKINEK